MKYKVGDKFIIEIEETADFNCEPWRYYKAKGFNSLVFDDFGLDKLEKYKDDNKTREKEIKDSYRLGMQEAWNIARRIIGIGAPGDYSYNDLVKIGLIEDGENYRQAFRNKNQNAEQVFVKCKAYDVERLNKLAADEKAKKVKVEEIRIGDKLRVKNKKINNGAFTMYKAGQIGTVVDILGDLRNIRIKFDNDECDTLLYLEEDLEKIIK